MITPEGTRVGELLAQLGVAVQLALLGLARVPTSGSRVGSGGSSVMPGSVLIAVTVIVRSSTLSAPSWATRVLLTQNSTELLLA